MVLGHINLITRFSSPPAPTFECLSAFFDAVKITCANQKPEESCVARLFPERVWLRETKRKMVFVICQIRVQSRVLKYKVPVVECFLGKQLQVITYGNRSNNTLYTTARRSRKRKVGG